MVGHDWPASSAWEKYFKYKEGNPQLPGEGGKKEAVATAMTLAACLYLPPFLGSEQQLPVRPSPGPILCQLWVVRVVTANERAWGLCDGPAPSWK